MSVVDILTYIKDGIASIWNFIATVTNLGASIVNLITGLFLDLFNTNYYASVTFSIILLGISLVIFYRIWNVIADIHAFGWKLPKL